jgi:hypothetical protein
MLAQLGEEQTLGLLVLGGELTPPTTPAKFTIEFKVSLWIDSFFLKTFRMSAFS